MLRVEEEPDDGLRISLICLNEMNVWTVLPDFTRRKGQKVPETIRPKPKCEDGTLTTQVKQLSYN